MAAPTTFGASIVPAAPYNNPALSNSPALTPAVSTEDLRGEANTKPVPPHSPFYQHPPASFEKIHSRQGSRTDINATPNEKDLEAGASTPLTVQQQQNDHPFASKVSVDCSKECRMWPSKQTLMQESQARRKRKRDQKTLGNVTGPVVEFWNRFDKRQKLWIKIALALVLVGVAVAIAVGITVAVNGTVYVGENRSQTIPDPNDQ